MLAFGEPGWRKSKMTRVAGIAVAFTAVVFAFPVLAQVQQIDPANSKITIHAYKTGIFSFAAHDHVVAGKKYKKCHGA